MSKDANKNISEKLKWKLLRKHISPSQLLGFISASLLGLTIVIIAVQFFQDSRPIFTSEDSFIKKDYITVTRTVSLAGSILGSTNEFTQKDIDDIKSQPWCRKIGTFTTNCYSVHASISVGGLGGARMGTMLFFESVPTEFIDVKNSDWKFDPAHPEIPVIMSRDYLSLYNFGFAKSSGLPQISESLASKVPLDFTLSGNGKEETIKGHLVGFSSRLNTIIVPQEFMEWSNSKFGSIKRLPSRLIVEVNSPGDPKMRQYMSDHGYQVASENAEQGDAQQFLNLMITLVIVAGIIISALAFIVLMLSIFLLLQKNTKKLQDLLLLGYSPGQVSRPYILMVMVINTAVLVVSIIIMLLVRLYYLPQLQGLGEPGGSIVPAIVVAVAIMALMGCSSIFIIKRKIGSLWIQQS